MSQSKSDKRQRFAIYTRYSSEMQNDLNGEFNGSVAPLGYDLIKAVDVTDKSQAGLVINPAISSIISEAFNLYATGEYTDLMIAQFINEQPAIQKIREGQKPVGKETARDLLQNRIYTGRVPYAETFYTGALGQGKKPPATAKNGLRVNTTQSSLMICLTNVS